MTRLATILAAASSRDVIWMMGRDGGERMNHIQVLRVPSWGFSLERGDYYYGWRWWLQIGPFLVLIGILPGVKDDGEQIGF